jgi:low-affinity inorganic phosphate transporter
VNWQKAIDIGASLVFSPMAGFLIAALVLMGLKWWRPLSKMHKTPEQRRKIDDKKHPPFWNRLVLVISAMAVSFVHGSNDGQKGIGLIMLVLIGIVPAQFVLDLQHHLPDRTHPRRDPALEPVLPAQSRNPGRVPGPGQKREGDLPEKFRCNPQQTEPTIAALLDTLKGVADYHSLNADQRIEVPLPALPGRHREESRQVARPGSA